MQPLYNQIQLLLLQGGNTTQPNTCGIHVHRGSTCGDAQGVDSVSCGGKRWVEAQGSELRQPKGPQKHTFNSEVLGLAPANVGFI